MCATKSYYIGWTEINRQGENMGPWNDRGTVGEIKIPEDAVIFNVNGGYVWWYQEV